MHLFWQFGYEGTSLDDLTKAINVNPSSIYSAFGDKKNLFFEALKLYSSTPMPAEQFISGCSSARSAAEGMLLGSAELFTGVETPPGCFMATAAISCSKNSMDVQKEIAQLRNQIGLCLEQKIIQDIQMKRLPQETDSKTLANFILGVIQGMSTLARDGKSREELKQLANLAMAAWPLAVPQF